MESCVKMKFIILKILFLFIVRIIIFVIVDVILDGDKMCCLEILGNILGFYFFWIENFFRNFFFFKDCCSFKF